jgi:glutathione S-transferase
MYELYIANKVYSSWSLRPWVLLRALNIPFAEHLLAFGDADAWQAYRRLSAAGKVPGLVDGDIVVWDSLAITEYLAERHAAVWPQPAAARAWARSAAAEMHSGFMQLRASCSMCCGIRVRLDNFPAALERDLQRLAALWNEGLRRFGGPFLAGAHFTAADAFYAPVAFRIQSYGLQLDAAAAAYAERLLALPAMQAWYAAALTERLRDPAREAEALQGQRTLLQDLRQPVR